MNNDFITKGMIDKIYQDNVKASTLLEMFNENSENNPISTNESGTVEPNEMDRKEELDKFGSQITSRVKIETFNIYPKEQNVTFGGTFTDMPSLRFEYNLQDVEGITLFTDGLKLTDEAVDRIKKLYGYYLNWSEEWAKKVINEYRDEK